MKPILEHTMAMVWRTENPDYIIILKHKAGKDMDFSKFKVVGKVNTKKTDTGNKEKKEPKEPKEPKKSNAKFVALVFKSETPGNVLIRVVDRKENNTVVVEVETYKRNTQLYIARLKKQYKHLRYDPKGDNELYKPAAVHPEGVEQADNNKKEDSGNQDELWLVF